jgi:putative membrane protein
MPILIRVTCHGRRATSGVPRGTGLACALVVCAPALLAAHAGQPVQPHDIWTAWSFEPWVVVPMAITMWLYARGVRRLRRSHDSKAAALYGRGAWRVRAFWWGMAGLAAALVSPVDALGGVLFSGHMLQHELLMLVAAPLLVACRPRVPFLWGLPERWTQAGAPLLRRAPRRLWAALTAPLAAWSLHGLALWIWHLPVLYEATLRSDLVHTLQHSSFFGSTLLFWWALLENRSGRAAYGLGFLYVFTTAVHSSILGALLTFAPTVWYPTYTATTAAWGLTPLEDQQLGGLLMWVPAGVLYVLSALFLFTAWMHGPSPAGGAGKPPWQSTAGAS